MYRIKQQIVTTFRSRNLSQILNEPTFVEGGVRVSECFVSEILPKFVASEILCHSICGFSVNLKKQILVRENHCKTMVGGTHPCFSFSSSSLACFKRWSFSHLKVWTRTTTFNWDSKFHVTILLPYFTPAQQQKFFKNNHYSVTTCTNSEVWRRKLAR